jgi:2-octaprenyl-6-methoxyphenol hydroxylase
MYDLIIVGGGPVGCAAAVALDGAGLSVLVLEASAAPDRRTLALSFGSRAFLERLGAWDRIHPATPIESIHVSQRGGFGRALLTAREAGVPALGYVASYAQVHAALAERLAASTHAEVRVGVRATGIAPGDDCAELVAQGSDGPQSVRARLIALADGGSFAPGYRSLDYAQSALAATIRTDRAHGNRAYERFTASGPIALLPAAEGCALIWTAEPADAQRLLQASDALFLRELQQAFGDRAGRFCAVSDRTQFPLALRIARSPREPRIVLLGNAAQTLHPVAGQGLNLGLRDASQLAAMLHTDARGIAQAAFAQRFARSRRVDRTSTIALTDLLVRGFSNDVAPMRWLRGCGLTMLDSLSPAKRDFMGRMMFGAWS